MIDNNQFIKQIDHFFLQEIKKIENGESLSFFFIRSDGMLLWSKIAANITVPLHEMTSLIAGSFHATKTLTAFHPRKENSNLNERLIFEIGDEQYLIHHLSLHGESYFFAAIENQHQHDNVKINLAKQRQEIKWLVNKAQLMLVVPKIQPLKRPTQNPHPHQHQEFKIISSMDSLNRKENGYLFGEILDKEMDDLFNF